ncbi:MAG: 50S ribosomal protein L4 [Candidatus Levyibacteriota bacterium]
MPVKKVKSQKSKVKSLIAKKTIVPSKVTVGGQAASTKTKGLNVQVFTAAGVSAGTMLLPKEIFGVEVNENLLAQAVRVYLANQRQGNASTKSRGEINMTTAKWYRQKGTGRARHGAKSAPIFVHGGVAHGPKPKDYSLKLPKKMKKSALVSALSAKQKNGQIRVLTGLEKIESKTKSVATLLKKLELSGNKTLLVTPDGIKKGFENIFRAGRNIEGVTILSAKTLNTYEVLDSRMILFMKQSIDTLKESLVKEQK